MRSPVFQLLFYVASSLIVTHTIVPRPLVVSAAFPGKNKATAEGGNRRSRSFGVSPARLSNWCHEKIQGTVSSISELPNGRKGGYPGLHMTMAVRHEHTANDSKPAGAAAPALYSDDKLLLQQVTKQQLVTLCQQFQLSVQGTKEQLLLRLRQYANEQMMLERQRHQDRHHRIQLGHDPSVSSQQRYEIITDEDYDDESIENIINNKYWENNEDDDKEENEDLFFYYDFIPQSSDNNNNSNTSKPPSTTITASITKEQDDKSNLARQQRNETLKVSSRSVITAPPPPAYPNVNGERVVTIYSTTDQNDLTGIAAAQPGQQFFNRNQDLQSVESQHDYNNNQPWNTGNSASGSNQVSQTTSTELDQAKEIVTELVENLLSRTGLRAFIGMGSIEEDDGGYEVNKAQLQGVTNTISNGASSNNRQSPSRRSSGKIMGFDPTLVPAELLSAATPALLIGRGQVLRDVLRQWELQAIGQDGVAGDNIDRGGGHYREVGKVRAFLEGYRQSEIRRQARGTVTFLLETLLLEGVDGLDRALTWMTRSGDDNQNDRNRAGPAGEHLPELNDSLLDYLQDSIRQQTKKVDELDAALATTRDVSSSVQQDHLPHNDPIDALWNRTFEDGDQIQSIDPADPRVLQALRDEYNNQIKTLEDKETLVITTTSCSGSGMDQEVDESRQSNASTPQHKLLLLLRLLRDRIQVEAAFGGGGNSGENQEKSHNLRVLAYCLRVGSDKEREQLISQHMGRSLDKLDSFIELVVSSIEYSESTSYQLQPSKKPLNVQHLKSIHSMAKSFRSKHPGGGKINM